MAATDQVRLRSQVLPVRSGPRCSPLDSSSLPLAPVHVHHAAGSVRVGLHHANDCRPAATPACGTAAGRTLPQLQH